MIPSITTVGVKEFRATLRKHLDAAEDGQIVRIERFNKVTRRVQVFELKVVV